jgi:hypothetical protein
MKVCIDQGLSLLTIMEAAFDPKLTLCFNQDVFKTDSQGVENVGTRTV